MSRDFAVASRKVSVIARILTRLGGSGGRILVVGCGDGREAGQLARELKADVIGIDIGAEFAFAREEAAPARLRTMDAQRLEFEEDSFDVIYSFHALEHIDDPTLALREMRRVLRPGGLFLIGTPNKQRVVGYIGSASPISDRIRWNIEDWKARLTGNWSNHLGAHAGFTLAELVSMCEYCFGHAEDVSDEYYLDLYANRASLVALLQKTGARRWAYPAVYVAGQRT